MIDEVVLGLQIDEIGAAIESDESDVADEVNEADKSDEADKADEVDEAGVSIEMPLLLPFSLTKYSAIFTEVKGSFGINNNQLWGPFGGNEINNQPAGSFQNVTFSIRIWNLS